MQVKDAIKYGIEKLNTSESKKIDSEILLCKVLKCVRTNLYTCPEKKISDIEKIIFKDLIDLRSKGYPIAYIIKQKEFWNQTLYVNENTLIPRPETELLVEISLKLQSLYSFNKILELGTGTGAIAIAIASEKPEISILVTDIRRDILEIAKKNVKLCKIENIKFLESDWFANINSSNYDLIVSNPPYICSGDPILENSDIRYEPTTSLVSGTDGLDDLRKIISQSHTYLKNNGWLILEHGYNQAMEVRKLFVKNNFTATTIKDYNEIERVTFGKLVQKK